jgi:hypothetical protein
MRKEAPKALDHGERVRPRPRRKLYRKPAFLEERVFETMALACGKILTTQGQCNFNRRLS